MPSSVAVSTIATMITPALLILGSASLVQSALVRMARVVDRTRYLASVANDRTWEKAGMTAALLRKSLMRHARRARYVELSIGVLYTAIVVFVATSLTIALDRAAAGLLSWLPVSLAVLGTLLLLVGGALMVAESRLSAYQINEEIHQLLSRLEEAR
jgi:hypothetical protein